MQWLPSKRAKEFLVATDIVDGARLLVSQTERSLWQNGVRPMKGVGQAVRVRSVSWRLGTGRGTPEIRICDRGTRDKPRQHRNYTVFGSRGYEGERKICARVTQNNRYVQDKVDTKVEQTNFFYYRSGPKASRLGCARPLPEGRGMSKTLRPSWLAGEEIVMGLGCDVFNCGWSFVMAV